MNVNLNDDASKDGEKEITEKEARTWNSWVRDLFNTVILNEAHKIKTFNTLISLSL